jgi:hypothetical protein
VPEHLAAAIDAARRDAGWLNNPRRGGCRCDGCAHGRWPAPLTEAAFAGRLARLTIGEAS